VSAEETATGSFGSFVATVQRAGHLVVQPRMGMSDHRTMRAGLLATRRASATTVGTITLDSYTRVGDHAEAQRAVATGRELNGYPLVAYDLSTTLAMLDGIAGPAFPVQVRHGSPRPERIVDALIAAGLNATEGGPVSYCLPYGRTLLQTSLASWARCCETLASVRDSGVEPHLESFGGCMLGQLCPPGLLVAISVLEGLFFRQHGLRSISLSYAQQANPDQDQEAVRALRRLAAERLPDLDVHVVIYAYMGLYPRTASGATGLLAEAARLAVRTGAARLIVKTAAEAHRIPSVDDNVRALETAAAVAEVERRRADAPAGGTAGEPEDVTDTATYAEANALVDAVLDLGPDVGRSLAEAFRRGYLDVPYCMHPDNAGRTRSHLDASGRLWWSRIGSMPLPEGSPTVRDADVSATGLLAALSYMQRTFDHAAPGADGRAGR
jgi:methylaspartate mutase epsilon subunit